MKYALENIKAAIFDMDGVLIDSEMVYLEQMYEQLKENYPWIQKEDLYPMVGMDDQATYEFLCRLARRSTDDISFRQEMKAMEAKCGVYFPDVLKPGVEEVLIYLREKGYKTAIASSSRGAVINRMLTECHLEQYFDYTVSGEEFTRSKPNPEIYLHTAEKLQADPSECFVTEDSNAGITAALAAGMTVAAVHEPRFNQDQEAAHMKITHLCELKSIL